MRNLIVPSKNDLLIEREWRRCRGNGPTDWKACRYFLRHYFNIRHPEKGRILFDLRPAQEEALKQCLSNRYVIILKARQIGWSTLMAGIALWLIYFHSDKYIIMLSRTEREAVKLLQKSKYGYKHMPDWMKGRGPSQVGSSAGNMLRMTFDNDSQLESLPSNSDPARGESVYMVIVDEWAFLPNQEEAWASIEPVADVGGRVIGLSTASGSGNFFHDFWVRATTGVTDFKPLFFPWAANTDRDQQWYETKKRTMTEWQLHQEYPRSAEEAFIKSGNPVFDTDQLALMPTYHPLIGYLDSARIQSDIELFGGQLVAGDKIPDFHQNQDGPFHRWQKPEPTHKYVLGADVAEGLEHGDFSAAHVIDITEGLVVAKWRGHIHPEDFAREIYRIGHYYNSALVGVETNNHGLTTITALNRWNYPYLYYRHTYDERNMRKSPKLGWYTSAKTKPFMIDELITALRPLSDGEYDLRLWDDETVGELKTFIRNPDGSMNGSPFDDQVISLAIANQMRKHSWTQAVETEVGPAWGTGDWWAKQIRNDEAPSWQIGTHSTRGQSRL